ncbi:MAG: STAS domain-containing protein [Anaerolineales bacterium]|nr:STAS domain-containing protein [Anaerolineales bacterium]
MLNIQTHFSDSVLVVELDGRLLAENIVVVWNGIVAALDQQDTARIVVNLNGINFIDSRGLAVLVTWLKRCRARQGDLFLCQVNPTVLNVIELTRLNLAFTIFDDEETAVNAFIQSIANL